MSRHSKTAGGPVENLPQFGAIWVAHVHMRHPAAFSLKERLDPPPGKIQKLINKYKMPRLHGRVEGAYGAGCQNVLHAQFL